MWWFGSDTRKLTSARISPKPEHKICAESLERTQGELNRQTDSQTYIQSVSVQHLAPILASRCLLRQPMTLVAVYLSVCLSVCLASRLS